MPTDTSFRSRAGKKTWGERETVRNTSLHSILLKAPNLHNPTLPASDRPHSFPFLQSSQQEIFKPKQLTTPTLLNLSSSKRAIRPPSTPKPLKTPTSHRIRLEGFNPEHPPPEFVPTTETSETLNHHYGIKD